MTGRDRNARRVSYAPALKKWPEFSKIHVIFADFFVFIVYLGSFVLSWNDKPPIDNVALAIISAYGAFATGGYFTQNIMRAKSLNNLKAEHVKNKYLPEEAHYDN